MKGEEDFVNEDVVSFNIDDKEYGYKPATADDENKWLPHYLKEERVWSEEQQKNIIIRKVDDELVNKCKMQNLLKVPWSSSLIYKILNKKDPEKGLETNDYEWANLNLEKKWDVLGRLKPKLFSNIILKTNEIDGVTVPTGGDATKKS